MTKTTLTQILVLVLLTLIIFVIQFISFRTFTPLLFSDNAIYSILAERFYEGNYDQAMHIWWQPLFPFLGSFLMLLGLNAPKSLFYLSIVSGTLLFLPVYYLYKSLTKNISFSLLTGILVAFNSKLLSSYFQVLTENLYVLFFTTAIFFSYTFLSKKSPYLMIPAGIFYGLGYLTRADILLTLQIFTISTFFLLLFKKIAFKKFLISLGTLSIVFLIVISPYLYFNLQKFGYLNLSAKLNASLWMPAYFAPQENLTTTYAQEVWSVDTPNYDSRYFNEKFDFGKYKENMVSDAIVKFKVYFRILRENNTGVEITLFFLGLLISTGYFFRNNKTGLFLVAVLFFNFIPAVPFHPGVDLRYLFWAYPLLVLFSILGVHLSIKASLFYLKKINLKIPVQEILYALFLIVATYFSIKISDNLSIPPNYNSHSSTDAHKIVGSYIKAISITEEKPRIMYRREAIGYYSKGELIYIPTSIGTEELKNYANLWSVDYLVADRFTFDPASPLGYLTDENKAPSWLKPIKTWEGEITKTVLYKFDL